MELGGTWRAIEASDLLRRTFMDPDFDDEGWAEIPVPGHWRSHPAFAASDGPVLHRRRFETTALGAPGRRTWLELDGIFYDGDIWLDRSYLGDTEGYFFPHLIEVTEACAAAREHVLAIEVACSRPSDLTAKRNLTGVFQHWDCFDRDWNPGGIWRPVRVVETGPARIRRLRVACPEATPERATLDLQVVVDVPSAGNATLVTTLRRGATVVADLRDERPLAAGDNRVAWRVPVERPELWWPAALGDQPLYDLSVAVELDGEVSDWRAVRTGLRQIRMRDFIATVNGERMFLKGANLGPTRRALGEASAEELEADVVLARGAGLDLLRVHGHISRPELYDAADRHGMLLWQDLPLQWGYAGVRRQAVRQAQEAVDLLGHHPSLAIWCGHNEPLAIDVDPERFAEEPTPRAARRTLARVAAGQVLPTWNKTALDRSVRRALEKADRSRPVVAHSGVLPHPAWGTDTHLYFGWYHGDERDLPAVLARLPVLARFVSEFGAQAVPTTADFCEPERWPDLDWPWLARAHALQKRNFDRYVPPAAHPSFESWRDATQAYQADLLRHQIEALRLLKYRPTGGFCQFSLADGQPAVSWSVLDHERVPKAGFDAMRAACAPVIVVAHRPAPSYAPGSQLALDVHVVSDLRTPLIGGRVRARLRWPAGEESWCFEGTVEADGCARVGTLRLALPEDAADGPIELEVDLEWAGGRARNHYASRIARGPFGPNGR